MAGTFKVDFDFRETVAIEPGYKLHDPYHATADVEWVEVVTNEPRRIELQHILIADGTIVKHWRQEWLYENQDLYEFAARDTWRHRRISADEAKGTWTQRVFSVDDSPRYQGYGRFAHRDGVSAWESDWTWRPLPRREATKRSDYDVVVGRNRHTLTETGWVHEQDNVKLVHRGGSDKVLAREFGLNRYERIEPAKADAAREYWRRTQTVWADVRSAWDAILVPGASVKIEPDTDDVPLAKAMSELADRGADPKTAPTASEVRDRIRDFVHPVDTAAGSVRAVSAR
jgi:hypothetical protein